MYDTIGYVRSLLLDCETQNLKVRNDFVDLGLKASDFLPLINSGPAGSIKFTNPGLSGLASAYVMFLFPLDMPITSYIQVRLDFMLHNSMS